MGSRGHLWQDLTWSWAVPTGHPASDHRIEVAAKAAWPFAVFCAWTYLNDHAAAHDIMDHAVENTSGYISRHPDSSDEKLLAHAKSAVKRRAQQLAAKKSREVSYGSLTEVESLYINQPDAEQRAIGKELLERFSPFAQAIVRWRWLGYSWRKIAQHLEMDHTVVRRAYFREVGSVLQSLRRPGDVS